MRHECRQAKVHTINKLTRESKKLKIKNGSEDQKNKNKRKAERLLEEVLVMKKLKDDDLSKFALCNKRLSSDVLADPTASIKDRALARLCIHPKISEHVKNFRAKFPTWNDTLPQLLQQLGAKRKNKKNKKVKASINEQKEKLSSALPSYNMVKDDVDSTSDNDDVKANQSQEVDRLQDTMNVTRKSDKNKSKDKRVKHNTVLDETDKIKMENKGVAEVKKFNEFISQEDNTEDDSSDATKVLSDLPEATTVDPFFMCEDGKTEYFTSVKVLTRTDEKNNVHKSHRRNVSVPSNWDVSEKKNSYQTNKQRNVYGQKRNTSNFKSFQQKPVVMDHLNRSKQSSLSMKRRKESHKTDKGIDEPVHPSWEAKRRIKEQQHSLFAFQGKKIVFDD